MKEELRHRSRSEIRRRAIFERQIQLATQDHCAISLLYSALDHHGALEHGSLEYRILEELVAAGERGDLDGVRIYGLSQSAELRKKARKMLLID